MTEQHPSQHHQQLPEKHKCKQQRAMDHFHDTILPSLLNQKKWEKVVDKDSKVTYRVFYFNNIKRGSGEDEIVYIK